MNCIISSCVINLAPDKPAVFREIARALRPGGRVALSDIALKHELPKAVAQSMAAYVGCIAGAVRIDDYRAGLLPADSSTLRSLTAEQTLTNAVLNRIMRRATRRVTRPYMHVEPSSNPRLT